ncbi:MAG: DUF3789 domain-containing protein [[Eubacterium] siraeum]
MTEFIFFIVGLLLGGCIGVVFMCCLQINRLYKTDSMKKEVEANEKEELLRSSFGFPVMKHRTYRRKPRKPA